MAKINQSSRPLKPAVFLDRDGTINVEKDYLYRIEDFEFIPGAPEAIKRLKEAGYLVIVVSNQSGVARGYYGLADVERLHDFIQAELANIGTSIDAFYICPHHPTEGTGEFCQACECRKPKPGMLRQAAEDLKVDMSRSFIVGDKLADIEAGRSVGITPILVETGYGIETRNEFRGLGETETQMTKDIATAVSKIL